MKRYKLIIANSIDELDWKINDFVSEVESMKGSVMSVVVRADRSREVKYSDKDGNEVTELEYVYWALLVYSV